jgi:hypothetical protein
MNLKKWEVILRVNVLGPGLRLMKKRIYRVAVLKMLRNAGIYDARPITILTTVLQLPTVFSTETCCTVL